MSDFVIIAVSSGLSVGLVAGIVLPSILTIAFPLHRKNYPATDSPKIRAYSKRFRY